MPQAPPELPDMQWHVGYQNDRDWTSEYATTADPPENEGEPDFYQVVDLPVLRQGDAQVLDEPQPAQGERPPRGRTTPASSSWEPMTIAHPLLWPQGTDPGEPGDLPRPRQRTHETIPNYLIVFQEYYLHNRNNLTALTELYTNVTNNPQRHNSGIMGNPARQYIAVNHNEVTLGSILNYLLVNKIQFNMEHEKNTRRQTLRVEVRRDRTHYDIQTYCDKTTSYLNIQQDYPNEQPCRPRQQPLCPRHRPHWWTLDWTLSEATGPAQDDLHYPPIPHLNTTSHDPPEQRPQQHDWAEPPQQDRSMLPQKIPGMRMATSLQKNSGSKTLREVGRTHQPHRHRKASIPTHLSTHNNQRLLNHIRPCYALNHMHYDLLTRLTP